MKIKTVLVLVIGISIFTNGDLQSKGDINNRKRKNYIEFYYTNSLHDSAQINPHDTTNKIKVENNIRYLSGSQADSIFKQINNFTCQAIFYKRDCILNNACFIRMQRNNEVYVIFDFSTSYINDEIVPNMNSEKFDWIYNCMCYMKSKENALSLPTLKIKEWRDSFKSKELLMWQNYKWKKLK